MHEATLRDIRALETDLGRAVGGEVRFDAATRAVYASDASNFRQAPLGVVIPATLDDVIATHRVCRDHGAPILPRGCGTSLSGAAVNYAVVIDCSRYLDEIGEVDPVQRTIRVQPGAINDNVNAAAGRHGLRFGPDPATHAYCTIGGNIGANACGVHSLQARFEGDGSRTSDNVASLDVLTYDGLRMEVGPTSDIELDRIVGSGGRPGQIYRDLRDLAQRYHSVIRQRFPAIPRRVSGYNLDELLPERGFNLAAALTGTEGTCVTILGATLKLINKPAARSLLVAGYRDIFQVGRHILEILESRPVGCETFDATLFPGSATGQDLGLPSGDAWVLVELGGDDRRHSDAKARELAERLQRHSLPPISLALFDSPEREQAVWRVRETGLARSSYWAGKDHWPGWEDSAVAPENIAAYLGDLGRLYERHGYHGSFYGHLGDGCIHSRIDFDLSETEGISRYRAFMEEAAELVVAHGGTLSGEHGDGQQRAELLGRMFGPELLHAFRQFKAIWDPEGRMNPGKVVDPYPLDQDLRLATPLHRVSLPLVFTYAARATPSYPAAASSTLNEPRPEGAVGAASAVAAASAVGAASESRGNRHDFGREALRCVGVGACRKTGSEDVMCPSFQVTRDERHSTRGRARLLFEMLRGDLVRQGWRSPAVREALDLCLSCKGCTSECPTGVDMPTYKAEFLHHHYQGRLRPRQAYAFGLVDKTAWLASRAPGVSNLITSSAPLAWLLRAAAGATQSRAIPRVAPMSLQEWFARRGERNHGRPVVVLWPDTFSNYFATDVGVAGVEAIEAAGWHVTMPTGHVCCGRPLYDYGLLGLAQDYLHRCLAALAPLMAEGVPVVGLEPSCVATFRHELPRLLPGNDAALMLSRQVLHFSELLGHPGSQALGPQGKRRPQGGAALWTHCHQKATGSSAADRQVLQDVGFEVSEIKGTCCGLAGSWGYEAGHYQLSLALGERTVFPAARAAAATSPAPAAGEEASPTLVANGFSCRAQIAHGGAASLHVAQAIAQAIAPGGIPAEPRPPIGLRIARMGPLLLALSLAGALGMVRAVRGRR